MNKNELNVGGLLSLSLIDKLGTGNLALGLMGIHQSLKKNA